MGDSGRSEDERRREASAASYASLGVQFVVAILLFLWVGKWLDAKLGTSPWLLIIGTFVGAAAGFYNLYRKIMADPHFGGPSKR
jgi:F0F1-type ATP synthase assembly protein I